MWNGADKVSINTAAIKNPALIKEASQIFGSQCIVLSIEAKRREGGRWEALTDNGREKSNIDVLDWVQKVAELGAGEILLTSVDKEGTQNGYDLELIQEVCNTVKIPVIACGGAGSIQDIEVLIKKELDVAASISSLFHYKKYSPESLKEELSNKGYNLRINN